MSLETGVTKLEGNAKKESQKLHAEGKMLKDEFEVGHERVQEHTKKAE